MDGLPRPVDRPSTPHFSSGPATKRPGWTVEALAGALTGRSHRSPDAKARLNEIIDRSRSLLRIPAEHRIAIVPGSDTGAVEAALWSLLGAAGVDVLAWESFGWGWATDIRDALRLADVRVLDADYGELPDLSRIDFSRDVVFAWNGTTSGVRVPDGLWIREDREGLTICDATSAAFAMDLPWDRLDATTYSWQKVLGGEAGHGMLILSPRAVDRLETHTPPWPIPKLFRLTKGGRLNEDLFAGSTINTPSMLAVEDALDGLRWAEALGGLAALIERTGANFAAIRAWVERTPWVDFLARDEAVRSPTSVCLRLVDPFITRMPPERQSAAAGRIAGLLEAEGVAYDISAHRDAPPGLRVWAGATVETSDLEALFPWLAWAHARIESEFSATA